MKNRAITGAEQVTRGRKKQASPAEPVLLDAAALKPFEIGARLDALLCYPRWSAERQQRVADAICARLVAHSIEVDPSRKANLWGAFPKYTMSRSRASLKTLDERRNDALRAGLAFLPLLKKAAIGKLPKSQEKDYEDFLHDRAKHGLRRFYPIAHLAAANQYIARERSGEADRAPFEYQDLDFHREVVRRANEYAGYFTAMPRWGNIADALIPIQWRE